MHTYILSIHRTAFISHCSIHTYEHENNNNFDYIFLSGGEEERFPLSKKNVMKVQQPGIALSDSKNSVDLPPRLPSLNARKALASPASIAAVTSLLHRLQTLLKPLIFALVSIL